MSSYICPTIIPSTTIPTTFSSCSLGSNPQYRSDHHEITNSHPSLWPTYHTVCVHQDEIRFLAFFCKKANQHLFEAFLPILPKHPRHFFVWTRTMDKRSVLIKNYLAYNQELFCLNQDWIMNIWGAQQHEKFWVSTVCYNIYDIETRIFCHQNMKSSKVNEMGNFWETAPSLKIAFCHNT